MDGMKGVLRFGDSGFKRLRLQFSPLSIYEGLWRALQGSAQSVFSTFKNEKQPKLLLKALVTPGNSAYLWLRWALL